MAHFARLDENGVVTQVIVVSNDVAPDPAPESSEAAGANFIESVLGVPGPWVQTSYSGSFRKQYAGIGFRYDNSADLFVAPSPYPSWELDEQHDWQPPIPMPSEGGPWDWDEDTLSWVEPE